MKFRLLLILVIFIAAYAYFVSQASRQALASYDRIAGQYRTISEYSSSIADGKINTILTQ